MNRGRRIGLSPTQKPHLTEALITDAQSPVLLDLPVDTTPRAQAAELPAPRSPGTRVVDTFGRAQEGTVPKPEGNEVPTNNKAAIPSHHSVRILNAMGREVDEDAVAEAVEAHQENFDYGDNTE
jgi:hypothetical protein